MKMNSLLVLYVERKFNCSLSTQVLKRVTFVYFKNKTPYHLHVFELVVFLVFCYTFLPLSK